MSYIIFVLFWYSKLEFSVLFGLSFQRIKKICEQATSWGKATTTTALLLLLLLATITLNNINISLLWVSNTQRFIHYKKFWKLKSSISERISFLPKESIIHRALDVISPKQKKNKTKKKQTNVINARPFIKGLRNLLLKVRICMPSVFPDLSDGIAYISWFI